MASSVDEHAFIFAAAEAPGIIDDIQASCQTMASVVLPALKKQRIALARRNMPPAGGHYDIRRAAVLADGGSLHNGQQAMPHAAMYFDSAAIYFALEISSPPSAGSVHDDFNL